MTNWEPGMPMNEEQMRHYIAGYMDATENAARLAQALIVLRFEDQVGADAACEIISRSGQIDAVSKRVGNVGEGQ